MRSRKERKSAPACFWRDAALELCPPGASVTANGLPEEQSIISYPLKRRRSWASVALPLSAATSRTFESGFKSCQWRALPKDLPPRSTAHGYLDLWNWDGTLDRIHHALYVKCREKAGRDASPTAAIIDSQSVKSAEKGGVASTLADTMRARKSKATSATSSSIRRAC